MKHTTSFFAITILISAGALGLTSCASKQVQGPETPVTSLKSEPASHPENHPAIPAIWAAAPSDASSLSPQPVSALLADQTVPDTAIDVAPAGFMPAPIPFNFQKFSAWDGIGFLWLICLLIALLLWESTQRLRSRRRPRLVLAVKQLPMGENPIDAPAAPVAEVMPATLESRNPFHHIIATVAPIVIYPLKRARLFLGNRPAPPSVKRFFPSIIPARPQKEIMVTAFHNGLEHTMHFSPSTTIKKITGWAAYQFGIFDQDATQIYLAIRGYSAPLTATAHLGRFVEHDKKHLELDVMTLAPANQVSGAV